MFGLLDRLDVIDIYCSLIITADMADDIIAEKEGLNRSLWIKPIKSAFRGIEFLAAAKESYLKDKWIDLN